MVGKQGPGGIRRRMYRLIGLFIITAGILLGWLSKDYRDTMDNPLGIEQTAYFEIAKGQGLVRVAQNLKNQGIVKKPVWFGLLAYLEGTHKRLKYGEYEITPQATPRSLLVMFVAGRVRQHPLTVVEGWTFKEMLAALARQPGLVQSIAGKSADEVMVMLGAPGQPSEGRFFPDTYFYTKGMADLEVLKRAYGKMHAVLDREWRGRAEQLPYATPYEALIMASIIEKESARPEERPMIAGVFVRRLAKGMRLQTDPTVIYGLGEGFTGDIRTDDLTRDTPYNTYMRPGLPPTPIALPGVESIRAALHPDHGASLYFVSRGDGTHVFSETLEQHQQAVEQFQKRIHD